MNMNMNLDVLKRPAVFGTIAGVIVLLVIWWFAFMSPEGSKLSSVKAQDASLQSQIAQLNTTIAGLQAQSRLVPSELPYLAKFTTAIPDLPESGVLTEQLFNLMHSTKTFISSLSDSQTASSGSGYSTIPVVITVTGSHDSIVAFLAGLYSLPRLVTIQNVAFGSSASQQSGILSPSKSPGFTATISATAYTTFVPPTP